MESPLTIALLALFGFLALWDLLHRGGRTLIDWLPYHKWVRPKRRR